MMPGRNYIMRLLVPLSILMTAVIGIGGFLIYHAGLHDNITQLVLVLTVTILISIFILSIFLKLIHRGWLASIDKLAQATDEMAAGRWDMQVHFIGEPALDSFAKRLNRLGEHARRQLQDLRHQRTELALVVDSLPDPIILTDLENRVLLLNEPAANFLQRTSENAKGEKILAILGEPRLLDLYERIISPVLPPGVMHMREINVLRNNHRYCYQAVAVRMATGVVMMLRDITTLATAIQMKTDFVANASHELRTPLAAIKLAFETLEVVYNEDADQTARCITIIAGHLKRLEDMIADLLDLSKVEGSEYKPDLTELFATDLAGIVNNTMGPLAREKQIDLSVNFDSQLSFVSDRLLLDLILKNLVENAVKYTPSGGSVNLSLSRNDSDQIVIVVKDTGIGIPPQHLERVFERFYQVDSARTGGGARGTGLGLAIIKHAVNALGGQIQLDSTVGAGTTATCMIPDGSKRSIEKDQ